MNTFIPLCPFNPEEAYWLDSSQWCLPVASYKAVFHRHFARHFSPQMYTLRSLKAAFTAVLYTSRVVVTSWFLHVWFTLLNNKHFYHRVVTVKFMWFVFFANFSLCSLSPYCCWLLCTSYSCQPYKTNLNCALFWLACCSFTVVVFLLYLYM
jgi:hypothetical protein